MTEYQKDVMNRCIGSILHYYQLGRECSPFQLEPGGFAERYKEEYPEYYAEEPELIDYIDKLIVVFFNSGSSSPP